MKYSPSQPVCVKEPHEILTLTAFVCHSTSSNTHPHSLCVSQHLMKYSPSQRLCVKVPHEILTLTASSFSAVCMAPDQWILSASDGMLVG